MNFLNIGILAHVDAGKTSLTERLLFNAGVIDHIGSVDDGNTQTDSLALERQRGITIKTAAVSFAIGDTTVNLLDTPGHPDFIAEVERVLSVLDGAVLVVSAVEGVQSQTRILMRALQRLKIPTVIFINKIDRRGARYDDLLVDIAQKLTSAIVPMGEVSGLGTPGATFELREHNQVYQPGTCPVFCGSAITGAGVAHFSSCLVESLPKAAGRADGQLSGAIFKVERGAAGEKIAYIRMLSGTIRTREVLQFGQQSTGRVTAISVFNKGTTARRHSIVAGEIGKLWGLDAIRVGDTIGDSSLRSERYFAPPSFETVVLPRNAAEKSALYAALAQLAEQDPFINLRQDDIRQELYVSLYGEVQKEVIQATLFSDFGIDVTFKQTTTMYVERLNGVGRAMEAGQRGDPFLATIGLQVEPGQRNSGVQFCLATDVIGTMPVAFFKAIEATVHETLRQGLYGWQVIDCVVTLTHAGYFPRQSHSHARFDKSMSSTGADFRGLTPLVLMDALKHAGTTVCEPLHQFELEIPFTALSGILPLLAKHTAVPQNIETLGEMCRITGDVPASYVYMLQKQLPAFTGGDGVLECVFDRYEAVHSAFPWRPRTDWNPTDRQEYMLHLAKRNSPL